MTLKYGRTTMRSLFLTLFSVACVLAFGASTASANHWTGGHATCSVPVDHGLMHGSNVDDSSYHARVQPSGCGYRKTCTAVNDRTGLSAYSGWVYGVSATCSQWLGSRYEAACGIAVVEAYTSNWNTVLSPHQHKSHHYSC